MNRPYGDGRTRVRDVQRDVEDAVPYGSETVGGLRDGGRGKPLPYGDGCTGVRDVQRDVEDAVPYGVARNIRGGAETAGGASPSPTETDVPGCGMYNGTSRTPSPTEAKPWAGCEMAGGASPSPTETIVPGSVSHKGDAGCGKAEARN